MKLIYENKKEKGNMLYQIYVDVEQEYFYIKAGGDIDQDFHTITNLMLLEEVEKYKYSRFIFDLSKQQSTTAQSRIWFVSYVVPKGYAILKNKDIYAAAISSFNPIETAFTHIIMRSINSFNSQINIRLFDLDSVQTAKKWILQGKEKLVIK
ncbi:hypothetical protein [Bernardetia sp.]|uniref:hypothetical protein n=1 Tax=Bernardetia sp. TaxID=1937974 RepID=UPI0025B88A7E|nr:hypothetical protein [Bernardetia sp.]